MSGDDKEQDVQPLAYEQVAAALARAEREITDWKRYYQEAEAERSKEKVLREKAVRDADYAREALNVLKGEYADLKERHDRAQGWIERARETEMPPERRVADRRARENPPYQMAEYGHKTPWHRL